MRYTLMVMDLKSPTCPVPVVISCLLFAFALPSGAVELTSTDGKSIDAEIQKVRNGQVVLKMGRKQFTLPVERFSAESRKLFDQWVEEEKKNRIPRLNVEINTGKSDRNDKSDSFDDRKGSFQFSVKITNEELEYDLTNASARLVVIGEDSEDRRRYGVMQKANFKVNAKEGDTFEWTGDALHYTFEWTGDALHYTFDNRPPAYWGTSYYGYVFQLKNESGKVIYEKTIPVKFEDHIEKILGFSNKQGFDAKANARGSITIYD